jgi:hypothetical protein
MSHDVFNPPNSSLKGVVDLIHQYLSKFSSPEKKLLRKHLSLIYLAKVSLLAEVLFLEQPTKDLFDS